MLRTATRTITPITITITITIAITTFAFTLMNTNVLHMVTPSTHSAVLAARKMDIDDLQRNTFLFKRTPGE